MPIRFEVEPILNFKGEVVRQLNPKRPLLLRDLDWLADEGARRLKRRFSDEVQNGFWEQHDEKAINVLKRASYIVGAQLAAKKKKGPSALESFFERSRFKPRKPIASAPSAKDNPFFWCLQLFNHRHQFISRGEKTKTSQALLYAYRNNVPPEFLTGFLLQIGKDNAIRWSADPEHRQRWFDGADRPRWINRLPEPSW